MAPITHEQDIICSETRLEGTTHEQTIIGRQLFAVHVAGSRPVERKKKNASNDINACLISDELKTCSDILSEYNQWEKFILSNFDASSDTCF